MNIHTWLLSIVWSQYKLGNYLPTSSLSLTMFWTLSRTCLIQNTSFAIESNNARQELIFSERTLSILSLASIERFILEVDSCITHYFEPKHTINSSPYYESLKFQHWLVSAWTRSVHCVGSITTTTTIEVPNLMVSTYYPYSCSLVPRIQKSFSYAQTCWLGTITYYRKQNKRPKASSCDPFGRFKNAIVKVKINFLSS